MNATLTRPDYDYDSMCLETQRKIEISHHAQTLYMNLRAANRTMVPWRNASQAVKREFIREAKQALGYE